MDKLEVQRSSSLRKLHLETSVLGAAISDYDGNILEVNDKLCDILGYTREELLYQVNWREITPPEYLPLDEKAVADLFMTGSSEPFEKQYIRKDKSRVDVLIGGNLLEDIPDKFICYIVDISAQKETDRALKESEARFRTMTDNMAMMVWISDETGKGVYFNKAWLDFTGKPLEEELGDGWLSTIHPDDLQYCYETCTAAKAQLGEINMEFRMLRHDGEYRWVLDRAVPHFSTDGEYIGYIGSCLDITDRKLAEQALVESEERYSRVVEGSNDGIWDWNILTGELYWNERLYEMHGLSSKTFELTYENFLALIHPEDQEPVLRSIQSHLEQGTKYELEIRQRHTSGEYRIFFARGKAVLDSMGKPIRMSGITTDITPRKQMEEALAHSEARFRRIVDSDMIGIVFWNRSEGRILDANDVFLNMVGYTREELVSGQVNWREMTPREYWHLDESAFKEMAVNGVSLPYEKQYFHKDGRRIDILLGVAYFESSRDEGVAFILDITNRKAAEQALQESEERFRIMADSAPVLIWMSDESGVFNYFNRQWLEFTGRKLSREMGDSWLESVHPDDRHLLLNGNAQRARQREEIQVEFRLKRAQDDQYRWILSNGVPRYTPAGEFAGYIGSCTDITDLKLAKEASEIANQKKSQFLANMSHELRTPLNAVIGYSEMMSGGLAGTLNEKQKKYIQNISLSGRHLLDMVNDILDISKIEAGKIELNLKRFHIQSLINDLQQILSEQAVKRNIHLQFDVHPNLTHMTADASRLKQIMLNLIGNAIKFSKSDSRVETRFTLSENAQWVVCDVEDYGIGIPQENLSDLFTEFYQVDSSYSRSQEGAGLGLALTKHLVELHGGQISVQSEENVGSVFTFKIPV